MRRIAKYVNGVGTNPQCVTAIEAEVRATKEGLEVAMREGQKCLTVFTDNQSICNWLEEGISGKWPWTVFENLFSISKMKQCFEYVTFKKVPKSWVEPAHILANYGRRNLEHAMFNLI